MSLHRARSLPPHRPFRVAFQAVWVLTEDIAREQVAAVIRAAATELGMDVEDIRVDQRHVIVTLYSTEQKLAFASAESLKGLSHERLSREFGPFEGSVWTPGLFVGRLQP